MGGKKKKKSIISKKGEKKMPGSRSKTGQDCARDARSSKKGREKKGGRVPSNL